MKWPAQHALATKLADKLGALAPNDRRLFAAAAADHVLTPFLASECRPEWVSALRDTLAMARAHAHGEATDAQLQNACDVARRIEREVWSYERSADEGELFAQALAHAAKATAIAASHAEGPVDARMWGFDDADELAAGEPADDHGAEDDVEDEDAAPPQDLSVAASLAAVESASTLAWYRAVEATNFTAAYYDVSEATIRGELDELTWQVDA